MREVGESKKGEKPWKSGDVKPNTTRDVKYMGIGSTVSLGG